MSVLPFGAHSICQGRRFNVRRDAQGTGCADDDPFERALAAFAVGAVRHRGHAPEAGFATARAGGTDDVLMLEIVAHVSLHTLMNYTHRLADTEIDFPVVEVQPRLKFHRKEKTTLRTHFQSFPGILRSRIIASTWTRPHL
jgi:hypothetical protein